MNNTNHILTKGQVIHDKYTVTFFLKKGSYAETYRVKDVKLGNVLLDEINSFFIQLTFIYQLIGFIRQHNQNFGSYRWRDPNKARTLLNQGLQKIGESPDVDELHPIVISLIDLLPEEQKPSDDDTILREG